MFEYQEQFRNNFVKELDVVKNAVANLVQTKMVLSKRDRKYLAKYFPKAGFIEMME